MSLDLVYDQYNYSLITINFHPSDSDSSEYFLENIFKPYIATFPIYILVTEYPNSIEQHIHAVIARPKELDNSKVLQKITGKRFLSKLKLNNTQIKNAVDCKALSTITDFYQSIGYCIKQVKIDSTFTNICKSDLEMCYKSWLYVSKQLLCKVDNMLEYKSITKGTLLMYLYDAAKKHPEVPISELPSFMVAQLNFSFIGVKSLINYSLLELKLKLSPIQSNIEQINLQEETNKNHGLYIEMSKSELIETIEKLEHTIQDMEFFINSSN